MKLRNKKTGEIGTLIVDGAYKFVTNFAVEDDEGNRLGEYNSLAELTEEWEDYEEPEMFYWIDYDGKICKAEIGTMDRTKIKEIGNYFETKEEAEKVVKKLKAWKRVKRDLVSLNWQRERDGSFSVWGEFKTGNTLRADVYLDIHSKDLDLLFSQEDD